MDQSSQEEEQSKQTGGQEIQKSDAGHTDCEAVASHGSALQSLPCVHWYASAPSPVESQTRIAK